MFARCHLTSPHTTMIEADDLQTSICNGDGAQTPATGFRQNVAPSAERLSGPGRRRSVPIYRRGGSVLLPAATETAPAGFVT